jgi:hypothetical protein
VSCRATGCDGREWMARKFCDRHWKMLPVDLQIELRKAIERNRRNGLPVDLSPLFERAQKAIDEKELQEGVAREIGLFRTHMASVAGVVAALRTIPVDDLRVQLSTSSDSFKRTDPDGYKEQQPRIEMDLEILELLGEVRERLGALIKRWQPVIAPDDETVEMHTNAPRGVGE